ncbi:MAG TPA: SDR family NAD(P)-dependent oxidoreductase [Anaerolineae bacterium]
MQDFKGKVAVITGAGSGIGRALAEQCVAEGMRVVLADINSVDLDNVETGLRATGAEVLAVQTDVSIGADIEHLAQKTLQAFGAVHLLFNNAGVMGASAGAAPWETALSDWEWVLGVNLWGVIHGVHVFTPIMLAQDCESCIVNTASVVGLLSHNPYAPYHVSKHAVVALTENLQYALTQAGSKVTAAVLCPGWANTHLMDVARYRTEAPVAAETATTQQMRQAASAGVSPRHVAECAFNGIRAKQLYIYTGDEANERIRERLAGILK